MKYQIVEIPNGCNTKQLKYQIAEIPNGWNTKQLKYQIDEIQNSWNTKFRYQTMKINNNIGTDNSYIMHKIIENVYNK